MTDHKASEWVMVNETEAVGSNHFLLCAVSLQDVLDHGTPQFSFFFVGFNEFGIFCDLSQTPGCDHKEAKTEIP